MRFRDKVFEEDWEKVKSETKRYPLILILHHVFGTAAIAIIILQSTLSLNIYVFTIWLILGLVTLLLDIFRGNKLALGSEMAFGFFFVFGTALSLLLGNINSMFFPDTLGRIDIILFQVSVGLCIVIRFLLALYYLEFKAHEGFYIVPISQYSQEQLKHYQDNLILTDFEQKIDEKIKLLEKWRFLFSKMFWPLVFMIILAVIAIAYSFLIYFIIPNDSIAELIIKPSLIVITVLYTIIVIRVHAILPKIKDGKDLLEEKQTKTSEIEELIEQAQL